TRNIERRCPVQIRRFVPAGETFPRGFGLAYREWERDGGWFYPLPLNWIVRWWRTVERFLAIPKMTRRDKEEMERARIIRNAISKLRIQPNDVILVNPEAIDLETLAKSSWCPFPVPILAVRPPKGESIRACIITEPIEHLAQVLELR